MSTYRKAKLKKALALTPKVAGEGFYYEGIRAENARLATLHEALAAAVEALEFYANPDLYCYSAGNGDQITEDPPGEKAREALSKIDKVLADLREE